MSLNGLRKIVDFYNLQEVRRCPFPVGVSKIYLDRLESNSHKVVNFVGQQKGGSLDFLFPVKADAYGSGMLPVAKFMEDRRLCTYFGVAHFIEAYHLREGGIKKPILILEQSLLRDEETDYIIKKNIDQAVSDAAAVIYLNSRAKLLRKKLSIHLSVDTGMGRGGVLFDEFLPLFNLIIKSPNLKLVGVMTHFSESDSCDESGMKYTKKQIDKFSQVRDVILKKCSGQKIIFHAANSGGVMNHNKGVFDMIRPGIAVYGYHGRDERFGLQPVMDLVSKVVLIKEYPRGHSIGYGQTYKIKKGKERVAIVPLGYGDGLNRALGNHFSVIINGRKFSSIGRISMDQFCVLIDESVQLGDEVIIIGEDRDVKNNAADLAKIAKTISYEILCNIGNSSRIRKQYFYSN